MTEIGSTGVPYEYGNDAGDQGTEGGGFKAVSLILV